MWALLLDKDPGHSTASTDLAVDVVEQKLKKAAAVTAVKVEEAPPAPTVVKPAKRVNKAKTNTKSVAKRSKQAEAASPAIVDVGGKVQINGAAGDNTQAAAADDGEELTDMWIRRYLSQETSKEVEEEAMFTVVAAGGGSRRKVATRKRKPTVDEGVTVTGANMWALLLDKDPGHSAAATNLAVDVVEQKLKKAAAITAVKVEEAPSACNVAKPAKRVNKAKMNTKSTAGCSKQAEPASAAIVDGAGKVQINVAAGDSKQAAASDHDEELTNMWMRRYYLSEEASKEKEEEATFAVVAARGGRRRTVAPRTGKPTVAEDVTVTGANMWALLSDEETAEVEEAPPADNIDGTNVGVRSGPGSGTKPAKRRKKTKTAKKKKTETPAAPPTELDEEMSEEEEEMGGEIATGGSRCRTVVSRVCRAFVAVALLGLYCRFASAPPV
jgi:hypothetical protein